jgi:addiction module HigA family antidote
MLASNMKAVHPGEILVEEFLTPMRLTCREIADDMGLPLRQINEIVQGKRGITAETALRLARYFSNSASFWFGLQMDYDLQTASNNDGERISREVKVYRSPD